MKDPEDEPMKDEENGKDSEEPRHDEPKMSQNGGAEADREVDNEAAHSVKCDDKEEGTEAKEEKQSLMPVKHSKRTPKPTQDYENFKNQQMHNRRVKKQAEKDQRASQGKRQVSSEKVKSPQEAEEAS